MRHFRMERVSLLKYFATLHADHLYLSHQYVVYSVPMSGTLNAHLQKLKRFDRVFETPDGIPVLRCICGNPLTLGPNGKLFAPTPKVSEPTQPPDFLEEANHLTADVSPENASFEPPQEIADLSPTVTRDLSPVDPLDSVPADLVPGPTDVPAPTAPDFPTSGVVPSPGVPYSFILNSLPAVGILPFIKWPSPNKSDRGPTPPPPPVPEPAPIAVLMLGLVSLLRLPRTGKAQH